MSNKTILSEEHAGDGPRLARARDLELEQVRQAVQGIRYGEVRVIIQDSVIVQIERVEKQRLR